MVTNEQADEIRQYLINEMESNGFGDVIRESNARINERFDLENVFPEGLALLSQFLNETQEILSDWSSHHLPGTIERLNEFTKREQGRIETIYIDLPGQGKNRYSLYELPDYRPLIRELRQIQNQILEDIG